MTAALRLRVLPALALLWAGSALAFDVPPPPSRFVYDGAGVLTAAQKAELEARVMQIDRQSDVQVAVAIFSSLEGEPLEDVSHQIAQKWGVGQKGADSGVLLSVFMQERKLRIEVGYGLEDEIPDATASRIIREQITPAFRAGDPARGISAGVNAISAAALGRELPPPAAGYTPSRGRQPAQGSGAGGFLCIMMVVGFFILNFIKALFRPRDYHRRYRNRYAHSSMPWWMWMILGNALSGGGHRHRGGGGFGGGGFGGGGGGSFGGGSFGGGGASGGW